MGSVQKTEAVFVAPSWKVLHNMRSEKICDRYGQVLPQSYGERVFRILRIELRHLTALFHPIIPMKLLGVGSPLLLEAKGSAVGTRATKVENLKPLLAGIF